MAELFPEVAYAVEDAIKDHRKGLQPDWDSASKPWSCEEMELALRIRMAPLKPLLEEFRQVATEIHEVLWPGKEVPLGAGQVVSVLADSLDRFDDWLESAARGGAEMALTYVMSWYAGIDLAKLKHFREGGFDARVRMPDELRGRATTLARVVPLDKYHHPFPRPDPSEGSDSDSSDGPVEKESDAAKGKSSAGCSGSAAQ
jgi:hypothetical protein